MASDRLEWQYFPKHSPSSEFIKKLVESFETELPRISSHNNVGQSSDAVLAKLRPSLESLGFQVEAGKTADAKIKVPVLYGRNGRVEKLSMQMHITPQNGLFWRLRRGGA